MSITFEETVGVVKRFKHFVATISWDGSSISFKIDPLLSGPLEGVVSYLQNLSDQKTSHDKFEMCVSMYKDIYTMICVSHHELKINTFYRMSDEQHLIISGMIVKITYQNVNHFIEMFSDIHDIASKKRTNT